MEKSLNKNTVSLLQRTLAVLITVISAIALPQLFHAFGVFAGVGGKFGQMFLPMYLPVLILALKTNVASGVIAGLISPLISYLISGMPEAVMLPVIAIELGCFGLFGGLISKKKINVFAKIIIVQVLSKIVRIIATVILSCFMDNIAISVALVFSTTLLALPGYIIQLLAVPYFVNKK